MLNRILLLTLLSVFGIACQSCANPDNLNLEKASASTSPTPVFEVPADWKKFEIGPFELYGPSDLKKKDIQSIDSEIYEYDNAEFRLSMDISIMLYGDDFELTEPSYEHETGLIIIDGKHASFIKGDLNKPSPTAAVNADGSKAKPVEKHRFITTFIPEGYAVVNIGYRQERSSHLAITILQSIRLKKNN